MAGIDMIVKNKGYKNNRTLDGTAEVIVPQGVGRSNMQQPHSTNLPVPIKQKKKDVAISDSLSSYLREIRQYPKLTPEQERELALRYFNEKDLEAAYQLVSSNLWLVVKIARDYERAAKNIMDLIQEGNIGLMEAVKNFDPFRDVRLPSYAVWWVKAYILRYIIANWRLVKIGTTQAQRRLFFNLHKEKEKLEREGFYPTPKLLAEKLDVKEKDVLEMQQRLAHGDLSLDAPVSSENENPLFSLLPSEGDSIEDVMVELERKSLIDDALIAFRSSLKERDQVIFDRRMLSEDKETLQDLSTTLELSKERVRQIESKIKEKLKLFLENRFGDELEDFIDVN
jgi:RNA polymerase sigma-32 factor